MVQKAKLDLLEDLPDIAISDVILPTAESPELQLPVFGEKWALNKLLLIGAPALIVVLVIAGVLWFYLAPTENTVTQLQSITRAGTPSAIMGEKKTPSADIAVAQATIDTAKANNAYFKDFIIDVNDKTGKSKILMCDIVFDVSSAGNIAGLENREDIRNMIYQTVTRKNAVVLRSLEERKRLKKELLQEANKMLGDGIIKNVYFINYVIM